MIAYTIDAINASLTANGATSPNGLGVQVPLQMQLSEWKEDQQIDVPLVVCYPTTEQVNYDLQSAPGLRSVVNRVPVMNVVIKGLNLLETEKIIHAVRLAIHDAGFGSMVQMGGAWNRDTHTNEYGRMYSMQFTCMIPVTRKQLRPVPDGTSFVIDQRVQGESSGEDVRVQLGNVDARGKYVQTQALTVWTCVGTEYLGEFQDAYPYTPTSVQRLDERTIQLTFSSAVTGAAYFETS